MSGVIVVDARVRSDRYDKDNIFGIFMIKMQSKIKAK